MAQEYSYPGISYYFCIILIIKIPPMADKTQRSFEKEYLEKRAEILQQFMDSVVESEVLRSSIQLLCFLKCSDEGQWGKLKEELEKNVKKTSVCLSLISEFAGPLFPEVVRRTRRFGGRGFREHLRRDKLQDHFIPERLRGGAR